MSPKPNRYEEDLRVKLSKTRTPITVAQYIKRLRIINDDKPLTSMKFLMDYDAVCAKLDAMTKAFTTKTSYLTAVCAVLGMYPKYSQVYQRYRTKLMSNSSEIKKELDTNTKNDKQEESIVPMKDILDVRNKLKVDFENAKTITSKVWDNFLAYVLICIYTMIPPRRNKDYSEMWFCFDEPSTLDASKNYYVASTDEFIFNTYKTAKHYGQQRVKIPADLATVLENYINYYQQVIDGNYKHHNEFPLLVHFNGERVHPINGITRLLNKAIGKRIGSSALRHIFLSDKYGDELKEMKEDASLMAHSLSEQKNYTKVD